MLTTEEQKYTAGLPTLFLHLVRSRACLQGKQAIVSEVYLRNIIMQAGREGDKKWN